MELLLQKNRAALREKKVYFSQKEKIQQAVSALNREKIIIVSGIKYAGKTKFLADLLRKTNQEETTFYYNGDIDFLGEIKSAQDLEVLLQLSEKLYGISKIIALQNCSKIEGIKNFIQKHYAEKKYKIIIIGNSISIEGVSNIEILPLSISALPHEKLENLIEFGSFEEIQLVRDISYKRFLRETLRNNIIFQDIVQTYNIKNGENIEKMLAYLSENNMYLSQRELQRELSFHGIEISLLSLMDYLSACLNSKILQKMSIYDIKKGKEITTRQKYYFSDTGLRNSFMRDGEKKKEILGENLIYTELLKQGYSIQAVQNGRFELHFEAKKAATVFHIYIHNSSDKNELKKNARKLEKIGMSSRKILLVESLQRYNLRNTKLGKVEILEIEDFLRKLN